MMSVKRRQNMLLFILPVTLLPIFVAEKTGIDWLNILSLGFLVVWFILYAIFWRCPYCNKKLPGLPSRDVEVCKHCGKDLTKED